MPLSITSLAAFLLHFAALPNFGKIELNLFYPKFSIPLLKFYSVKFCLFKADICLYRIFTIGIWQGMKSSFDRIGVMEKNIKHQCRESYPKGAAIFHWVLRSCKRERKKELWKGAVKRQDSGGIGLNCKSNFKIISYCGHILIYYFSGKIYLYLNRIEFCTQEV